MTAIEIIQNLERREFYGVVEFRFRKGRVVSVEKRETFQVQDNPLEEPKAAKCVVLSTSPMRLTTR